MLRYNVNIREVKNVKKDKLYIENLFKDLIDKNIFIKATVSNPVNKKMG